MSAGPQVYVRPCVPRDHFYALTNAGSLLCASCTTPEACSTARQLTSTQESVTVPDTNPKSARAIADGKLRLELIETALTHPLARVMAHGADKYGVRNWRTQPIYARTYVGAMRRHIDAWADGQDSDPDSGEHHLVHLAACCMVVLDALAFGTLEDNRDYAEAGVPGGVAANQPDGVKPSVPCKGCELSEQDGFCYANGCVTVLTPEYERGQELVEELAAEAVERVDCGGLVLTQEMRDMHPGAEFFNCRTPGYDPCDTQPLRHGDPHPDNGPPHGLPPSCYVPHHPV